MKPLIDIWFYVLYNDDMFAPAQKHDSNETIRLNPIEQTDFYEILSLDKAGVLESYLKGEKHDPKDIVMNLTVNIRAFYLFITEPKSGIDNTELKEEKSSNVRTWWSSDKSVSGESSPNEESSQVESSPQVIRKPKLFRPETMTINPFKHFHSLENTPKVNQSIGSNSFQEHLRDVEKDGGSNFIDEDLGINREYSHDPSKLEKEYEKQVSSSKNWWNQKLLLIVEILHINAKVNQYQNGKKEDKDVIFSSSIVIN